MASGYSTFTNQGYGVEGGPRPAPPSYEQSRVTAPTAPPQHPQEYSQQQPRTSQYPPLVTKMPGQQTMVHVTNTHIPNDHFGFALFVTIFCCLPFGIVALVKSSEVKTRAAVGDFYGATISSLETKRWSKIALIIGIVIWVLGIIGASVMVALAIETKDEYDHEE